MIKVGLTGGIGSGKTTIAGFFENLGIPVYYADVEAKRIMNTDPVVQQSIISLLGQDSYKNQSLNRPYIASIVFKNKDKLQGLNAIAHPAVKKDFDFWASSQNAPYVIKEAAVLFENEGYKECDFTILVTAPKEIRLRRVMKRDQSTKQQVVSRMNAQWEDYKKIALTDTVIENKDLRIAQATVRRIHLHLKKRLERGWV